SCGWLGFGARGAPAGTQKGIAGRSRSFSDRAVSWMKTGWPARGIRGEFPARIWREASPGRGSWEVRKWKGRNGIVGRGRRTARGRTVPGIAVWPQYPDPKRRSRAESACQNGANEAKIARALAPAVIQFVSGFG